MSDRIVYRSEKNRQLTSAEVDGNFRYLDERINKVAQKDYFIFDAGYSKTDSAITINPGMKWLIGGVEIESAVGFTFQFTRADWVKYRVDVIVASADGSLSIVEGQENESGYVVPILSGNYLPYLYVYVSDAGLQNIGTDAVGDYVSKLSYQWVKVDLRDKQLALNINKRNIEVIGGNSFTGNTMNGLFGFELEQNFPDGFEVAVRNLRTDFITIVHNDLQAEKPIKLYSQKNYFLRPNEVINFRYVKSDDCFVVSGALDIQLTTDNIDDLIGTDSLRLFIDSSEGDLISADNLQTTLTATVERYFNDFTNEVVSWQWFRESGDAQEDRDSDAMWSVGKTSRIVHLTAADFTPNIYNRSIIFTCQAIVQNQRLTTQTAIG